MGGDVTGGYVIMVPNLSWYDKSFVRGLQEEWFTRLSKIPGAVTAPGLDQVGCTDPALLHPWRAFHDCVSRDGYGGCKPSCLVRSVYFEPNQLKIEMDKMLLEHKDAIRVMCHSMGVRPILEGGRVKGVVYESKEGRKAILAQDRDRRHRRRRPVLPGRRPLPEHGRPGDPAPTPPPWCGGSAASTGTCSTSGAAPTRTRWPPCAWV